MLHDTVRTIIERTAGKERRIEQAARLLFQLLDQATGGIPGIEVEEGEKAFALDCSEFVASWPELHLLGWTCELDYDVETAEVSLGGGPIGHVDHKFGGLRDDDGKRITAEALAALIDKSIVETPGMT